MIKYTYCPVCREKLVNKQVNSHERQTCPNCGFVFFQNPKPTVGIYIVENGKVLLARRKNEPFKNFWSGVGGFVENGEAPHETAVRETREETGLEIEITNLIGMGKDVYSGEHIIPIAFEAKIVGGQLKAQDDAVEVAWFPLGELPENIAFGSGRKSLEALRKKHKN